MNRRFRPNLVVVATGLAVALSLFGDMAMYVILLVDHSPHRGDNLQQRLRADRYH